MKKKAFILLLLIIFICSVFISCTKKSDPIKDDLINYIDNNLQPLLPIEKEAINDYISIVGKNYSNDIESYTVLNKLVVPKYTKFIDELQKIHPNTKELKTLHESYVKASNKQLQCFIDYKDAVKIKNKSKINNTNKSFEECRKEISNFKINLKKLASDHGVEIK